MFTKRIACICAPFVICGLLAAVLLLGLSFSRAGAESGAGTSAVARYVSPLGHDASNDCSSAATPCRTVQYAVTLTWASSASASSPTRRASSWAIAGMPIVGIACPDGAI